jgi:hypothetical protein
MEFDIQVKMNTTVLMSFFGPWYMDGAFGMTCLGKVDFIIDSVYGHQSMVKRNRLASSVCY